MRLPQRPKYQNPPPPQELNPRKAFSTRQLPSGSPVFDKVFPCALGFGIGFAIISSLLVSSPEGLEFSTWGVNLPLVNGGMFGFSFGLLVSPICLWLKKGKDSSGILWVTILLGLLFGYGAALIG